MTDPRFSPEAHSTWKRLFEGQREAIKKDIHPLFSQGLESLGITAERIPELSDVNVRLREKTGFTGKYVDGLKEAVDFFPMLARGEFPVGNFIRDAKDLAYTPAPDVFHDLFGHLPYLADPDYADFTRRFGALASRHENSPDTMKEFDRLYWFILEFGLIRHEGRAKVFGSGIASSHAETLYALSPEPEVLPFNLEQVRTQDFRIDVMQKRLFIFESLPELYGCLNGI